MYWSAVIAVYKKLLEKEVNNKMDKNILTAKKIIYNNGDLQEVIGNALCKKLDCDNVTIHPCSDGVHFELEKCNANKDTVRSNVNESIKEVLSEEKVENIEDIYMLKMTNLLHSGASDYIIII